MTSSKGQGSRPAACSGLSGWEASVSDGDRDAPRVMPGAPGRDRRRGQAVEREAPHTRDPDGRSGHLPGGQDQDRERQGSRRGCRETATGGIGWDGAQRGEIMIIFTRTGQTVLEISGPAPEVQVTRRALEAEGIRFTFQNGTAYAVFPQESRLLPLLPAVGTCWDTSWWLAKEVMVDGEAVQDYAEWQDRRFAAERGVL